jgi:hypothetical protein
VPGEGVHFELFVLLCLIQWHFGQGMVSLVSSDALHQLHIFVFFLAVFHVVFSALTMSLSRAKVRLVLTSCGLPFLDSPREQKPEAGSQFGFFCADADMEGVGKGNLLPHL